MAAVQAPIPAEVADAETHFMERNDKVDLQEKLQVGKKDKHEFSSQSTIGPVSVMPTDESADSDGEWETGDAHSQAGGDEDDVQDTPASKELRSFREREHAIGQRLEHAGRDEIVDAVSVVLTHLVSFGNKPQRATIFHATRPPPISVKEYLTRIAKYYDCSDACLVLGLVYIDRLVKTHPGFVVSKFNVHRLLSVGIMLAAKFQDDVYYSNAHYGQVAGLQVTEMNSLEERFLRMLSWRLTVLPSEYEAYLDHVLGCVGA